MEVENEEECTERPEEGKDCKWKTARSVSVIRETKRVGRTETIFEESLRERVGLWLGEADFGGLLRVFIGWE